MQQFVLPFSSEHPYTTSDFIISDCNKEAFTLITSWPKVWGVHPYEHSLLLEAPKASGKTHLAKIWQEKSSALFCTPATSEESLKNHHSFIIEAPETWDERQLLHYFNFINENCGYLLLTSTASSFTLSDLRSRINSLQKVRIEPLDDHLMKTLLRKYFSASSVNVTEQVIGFLLHKLQRNFEAIKKATEEINGYALAHKRSVTIPMLKEIGPQLFIK